MFRQIVPVCLLLAVVALSYGERIDLERSVMDQILSGYNKELRPPGDNATVVTVNTYIRNIYSICEKTHTWKAQLTFRQEWNDHRLAYSTTSYPNYKFLTLASKKEIWTPDLFFSNELDAKFHDVPQPHVLLRIHPNGDVLYSIRITLTLTCPGTAGSGSAPGELTCPIIAASYAYNTEEILLKWKAQEPVQVSTRIELSDFTVGEVTTGTTDSATSAGSFSNVVAKVHLRRKKCLA